MATEPLQSAVVYHRLDSHDAAVLIQDELVSGRVVRVTTGTSNRAIAEGRVSANDGDSVSIELITPVDALLDSSCAIAIDVQGKPFAIHAAGALQGPTTVVIRLPARVMRIERRRSRRRSFARVRNTILQINGGLSLPVALLNLSADGLACRIGREDASHLSIRQRVLARICLAQNHMVELDADVVSITPLASQDSFAIGLEFNHSDAERSLLIDLLEQDPQPGDRC